jgi:enamine deaminase RidA (YjgF/YER057c/UK114 family)
VSLDQNGQVVGGNSMDQQVDQTLANIASCLAGLGGRMSDVISLDQRTTDIASFMQCGPTRQKYFHPPYPVTTTVEVSALYDPRLLIEITAIAEIPRDRFAQPSGSSEMHGQNQA